MSFVWETPEEINMALAKRFSLIRKRRKLSQVELSQKSNVSYGSIKRFETSGQISLISLTKLCVALDCADEIRKLFTDVEYRSIDEVLSLILSFGSSTPRKPTTSSSFTTGTANRL